jgi:hypothetical protein
MVDAKVAERLVGELRADRRDDRRLGRVRRYLRGRHDLVYMPKGAKQEYKTLAQRAVTNWLPLLSDTFAQGLFVDGYRSGNSGEPSPSWDYWQANGMDARQSILHRGVVDHGTAYELVLPGTVQTRRVPVMRPLSPWKSLAWYDDDDAEFPVLGLREKGQTVDGATLFEVFDRTSVYTFAEKDGKFHLSRTDDHGLGVTPFVRFRDRLDDQAVGLIAPAIVLQDRINEIVFATLIAIQYASFRQRWASGLVIPYDEDEFLADGVTPNPNFGKPIESFEAAVDRLWVTDNADARFGDFAQTEVSGHLNAYLESVRTLAATNQISPNVFTGDLVNLSGDALATLKQGTIQRTEGLQILLGESHESAFRLAARAAGDREASVDTTASTRWRDVGGQSLLTAVESLGKMVSDLKVPAEATWERIPGVTDDDVKVWKTLAAKPDTAALLTEALTRRTESTVPTDPAAFSEVAPPA